MSRELSLLATSDPFSFMRVVVVMPIVFVQVSSAAAHRTADKRSPATTS